MNKETKTALITGFTGQDGTWLADHLLEQDYKVVGLNRRISTEPPRRIRGGYDFAEAIANEQLVLEPADLLSVRSLMKVCRNHRPDEVYNLAAQSHVGVSFEQPEITTETNYLGLLNLMTALDEHVPDARLYQASTSEMYGDSQFARPRGFSEIDEFNPNSPYAISKLAAHYAIRARRKMGYFACSGILFNHESELRGGDFVTQKIVDGVYKWDKTKEPIKLGNLDAKRDWGFAGDYVKAMHLINTIDQPGEYVIGTGETHSVREFAEVAFKSAGFNINWVGQQTLEKGFVWGQPAVEVDKQFYRPNDVNYLKADSSKAHDRLGWQPEMDFDSLVKRMLEARYNAGDS